MRHIYNLKKSYEGRKILGVNITDISQEKEQLN